jgi:hypothetical protein
VLLVAEVAAVVPLVGLLVLQTQLQEACAVEEADQGQSHPLITVLLQWQKRKPMLIRPSLRKKKQ